MAVISDSHNYFGAYYRAEENNGTQLLRRNQKTKPKYHVK
jgi:hypothetical protein